MLWRLHLAFLAYLVTKTLAKCPKSCICETLEDNHRTIVCSAVEWTSIPRLDENFESVDFTNNNISKIDSEFQGLFSLSRIFLSYNQISNIYEHAFKDLHNLTYLDLSYNQITHIEATSFRHNTKLTNLYLKQNPIYFSGYAPWIHSHSLIVLDISFCKTDYVPEHAFDKASNIKNLNLEGITRIPSESLAPLKKLKHLYVQNNSIDCTDVFLNIVVVHQILVHVNRNGNATSTEFCEMIHSTTFTEHSVFQTSEIYSEIVHNSKENISIFAKIMVNNSANNVTEEQNLQASMEEKSSSIDVFTLVLGLSVCAGVLVICVSIYIAIFQCRKKKIKKRRRKLPPPAILRRGQRLAEPEYDYPMRPRPEYLEIQGDFPEQNDEYLQPVSHPDVVLSANPAAAHQYEPESAAVYQSHHKYERTSTHSPYRKFDRANNSEYSPEEFEDDAYELQMVPETDHPERNTYKPTATKPDKIEKRKELYHPMVPIRVYDRSGKDAERYFRPPNSYSKGYQYKDMKGAIYEPPPVSVGKHNDRHSYKNPETEVYKSTTVPVRNNDSRHSQGTSGIIYYQKR